MNNIFVQCGVAGAALFILFALGKELFKYLNKKADIDKDSSKQDNKNNNAALANVANSMNRLVDKMDKFIEVVNKNAIDSAKCQASLETSNVNNTSLIQTVINNQQYIITTIDRIDERTKILIPKKEGARV